MARYFLECAYKGTRYSGFQVQENAITIQSEIEKAFQTLHGGTLELTGSSRTDAGVHALQNFFHFDFQETIHPQAVYKLNAILPGDIVIKNIILMREEAHSRFDATSREYEYHIHNFKNPFLKETSLYYPYKLNYSIMEQGASFIKEQQNFFAFSKTNTQVKNFNCLISKSQWTFNEETIYYEIAANRFLRGMVRLITATLLKLGRGKLSLDEFKSLLHANRKCGYSIPAHGLYLKRVIYLENYFPAIAKRFTEF
jgi:tRNA pseudouridine38-40 synthase